MDVNQGFPNLPSAIVDRNTLGPTPNFYRFLLTLWNRSGGGGGTDVTTLEQDIQSVDTQQLLIDEGTSQGAGSSDGETLSALAGDDGDEGSLGTPFAVFDDDAQPQLRAPIFPVSVGASPFTYQAPVEGRALIVSGTISAIDFTRDGTNFLACPQSGFVPMSPGDCVRITYSATPTMNFIPR